MAPAGDEGMTGELLPGEDSAVTDPVELQHWISLYEERREIVRRRLERAKDTATQARMQDYLGWLDQRVAFWRNRHAQLAGILLNPQTRTMTGRDGRVSLTRREYELLSYLADHPGRHVPAGLLVGRAWPDSDLCEEQLRTYVARLRRKMAEAGTPCRIVADRPRGYVLLFDEDVSAETGASIAS
jgi:DNA-binding response OmpR family regulator